MFEGGDVEGSYDEEVLQRERIEVMRGVDGDLDCDLEMVLGWMVDMVIEEVKRYE